MIALHLLRVLWYYDEYREPYDEWCPGVPQYRVYAGIIRGSGWVLSTTFYQYIGDCQRSGRMIRHA